MIKNPLVRRYPPGRAVKPVLLLLVRSLPITPASLYDFQLYVAARDLDIPVGQVILNEKNLVIQAPDLNGEYNGTITGDSTMVGTWSQNGADFPLNLKKLSTNLTNNIPK